MKNINLQYRELLEGKMNQAQFLRNARMMFPNFVTNHNSFDDSIKILKTKGMITEGDAVKGTPDKAPTYDYPTQPGKYKTVEQSPEVDEQDGVYPATTLTDIPKEKVSKPTKSKTRPDGLEPIKNNDTKNEMKKVKVVKENVDIEIKKLIDTKKIDPAKVKAAAEKAMRGDSTELAFLMAFGDKVKPVSEDYNSYDEPPHDRPRYKGWDWESDADYEDEDDEEKDLDENEKSFDKIFADFIESDDTTELKTYIKAKGKEAIAKIKSKLPGLYDKARQKVAKLLKAELNEARFKKGTNVGKPGHNFAKIEKKGEKSYLKHHTKPGEKPSTIVRKHAEEVGKKIAGNIQNKVLAKEAQNETPADSIAVITLLDRIPQLANKTRLINDANELQQIFDYFLDRINPSLSVNPTQLRTALNNAIQVNLDIKKAEKQAGTPPTPPNSGIKDKLKPAITKLVQEVLDEMGPQ